MGGLPIKPSKTWQCTKLLYIFHFHLIKEEEMFLPVASLFTTSYKPSSTTWTVVGMLILFNSCNEYTSKLKMFGILKADFWKCDRKTTSTGMHVSLIGVCSVILVTVQFYGRMRVRLSDGKYTIASKFDVSFISLNRDNKIPHVTFAF